MTAKTAPRSILPVTLGTAGHIDHGKTTLLRALAGGESDTDRLAEERERGLTIDVGYAELALDDGLEVGVVDVPGHEKFVRNMVAGATGIDVVLLVVAADDGVMPQTREHLDIMSLLGLTTGVVALTKSDLVDPEMLELVSSEVEDLVQGTFLEGAPILPVSATTGTGIDALRAALSVKVRAAPRRDAGGLFRMPILRVFTSQGFGTILTGIPVSGRLALGDRVTVEPGARAGRVRGLQVYHRAAEQASAGHRTAINLAELQHHKVQRGDVVCVPGVFEGTQLLDVKLSMLRSLPRPLRHNQECRLHVGTLECAARVLLLGRKSLPPGETEFAQLKLDRPAVAAPGDRYILRLPAQLVTLGGGVVLGAGSHARRRRASLTPLFEERERGLTDLGVAVEGAVRRASLEGTDAARLVKELLRRPEEIEPELSRLRDTGAVVDLGRGLLLHGDEAAQGRKAVLDVLAAHHERHPLSLGMRKALLPDAVHGTIPVVDGLVDVLIAAEEVEPLPGGLVRLHGRRPRLTEAQERRLEAILENLSRDPWGTPRNHELPGLVSGLADEVEQLLLLLELDGRIARMKDGVLLLSATVEDAKVRIREHFRTHDDLKPSDLKDLLGISRKYGIPLLEHLDRIGFTRREGDRRVLREG